MTFSHGLFQILKEKGFLASGTARESRIAGCILDDSRNMGRKKHRGSYDFAFNKDAKTCAIKWNNNAVVTIVTNNDTILPIKNAKRYSPKERKEVLISQPNVISDYNKHMGGVDLQDNATSNYPIKIQDFGCYIAIALFKSESENNSSGQSTLQITLPNKGRPSFAAQPKEVRTDRIGYGSSMLMFNIWWPIGSITALGNAR
nr:piggyBac transposable element-derived protein 2-like [Parasteatoda tepidariorum]